MEGSGRQARHLLAIIFAAAGLYPAAPAMARETHATLAVGITIVASCTATTRQPTPVSCGSRDAPIVTTGDAAAPSGGSFSSAAGSSQTQNVRYLTILF